MVSRGHWGTDRDAWSAPLAAVTPELPKLIVRVRFSSPAPMKAQVKSGEALCLPAAPLLSQ
jgi:hypothetical protein